MGQWVLALAGLVVLLLFWVGLVAAVGYLSALAVGFLPLVGRRKSVPGARAARDRVVFRDSGDQR